ncbi:MAG: putative LPS assembly protein LptD [Acidobacteriota bacterium]
MRLCLLLVLAASALAAQQPDSLRQRSGSADTLSLSARDTTAKSASGIDSAVAYTSADSIVFNYNSKVMSLYGKGDVKYKTMALKSERIEVEMNDDRLEAYGVLDSSKATNPDSIRQRYIGTPVMVDGSETYEGFRIAYNFKTQKGRITLGETAKDQGYYYGGHIKKVEPDVLFIADGRFTTCSLGHPHYFFLSPEMRVTVKDKIVARPIYLYISDVPLFALPFGVFPSQGGRRSGIIAPAYGDDNQRGRYLSHFGYYFALSDYYDLALSGDWYTNGSWSAMPRFRYAKRYDFSGDLSFVYSRYRTGEESDPDRRDEQYYNASIVHNQQFNPTTRLDVNFTFASSNSFLATPDNYAWRLNQNVTSNATLSKSWEGTNNSMLINVNQTQDLRLGNMTSTLPSISFSHAQSFPFRSSRRARSEAGYSWYEMIGVSYQGVAQHAESKTRSIDTAAFTRLNRNGAQHSIGISYAPKAGYFTITPQFSYQERWYDKSRRVTGLDTSGLPVYEDVKGFNAVRTFQTGVSVSTKLYGMMRSPVAGIEGFRHTLQPAVSYVFTPDFSKPFWGYWGSYTDKHGVLKRYDRFDGALYGGAPSGESQAINVSVTNLFEMKTAPRDTAVKPEKYQLLNLTASTGYNFAAERLNLQPLSIFYRTSIGQVLDISGSNTYDFYMYDRASNARINKLLFKNTGRIADLTSFTLNISTSLKGEKRRAETPEQASDSIRVEEQRRSRQSGVHELYMDDVPDFSIPWNLTAAFSYSLSQYDPTRPVRSASLMLNGGFNLTENWRFTVSTNYDLITRQFAAPSINIFRDLHCWEMNFNWRPSGTMAGYRLEIRVKAPQLQDVKVTKQSLGGF